MRETPISDLARHACPTALATGQWQLYLIAALYFFTALASLNEFVRAARKKWITFRTAFMGLAFAIMIMRSILTFVPFHSWTMFSLLFVDLLLPIYLQFVTYSLLVLFIAKCYLILKGQADGLNRLVYPIYGAVTVLLFVCCVLLAWAIADLWDVKIEAYDTLITPYTALAFFLLLTSASVFGYKISKLLSSFALEGKRKRSMNRFVLLLCIYFGLFSTRILWNILAFFNANPLQTLFGEWNRDNDSRYLTAFMLFYLVVEILPYSFIVITFHRIQPIKLREASIGRSTLLDQSTEVYNPLLTIMMDTPRSSIVAVNILSTASGATSPLLGYNGLSDRHRTDSSDGSIASSRSTAECSPIIVSYNRKRP
eukprot:GILK01001943.1.p1 GENE.GILK01001943.1~~GILK01001943.1.p1  ORF type:complete len:369 (+),score=41.36 GILK01001943.1:152-1258(+)